MPASERPRATTRVVIDRGLNAFDRLTSIERRRLMVRVLCGLVAYDEPGEPARPGEARSVEDVPNVDLVLDLRSRPVEPVTP